MKVWPSPNSAIDKKAFNDTEEKLWKETEMSDNKIILNVKLKMKKQLEAKSFQGRQITASYEIP